MRKRGQLTLIVIVGIVIVSALIGVILFSTNNTTFQPQNQETREIEEAVQECLKQRSIDAIRIIGLQGGNLRQPQQYIISEGQIIGYGYSNGEILLPEIENLQSEISDYIKATLPYCIDKEDFPQSQIQIGDPTAKTIIKKDNVEISAQLPLTIEENNKTYTIDRTFKTEIPIRLGRIYESARDIVVSTKQDPGYVDLSLLYSLGFFVGVYPYDNQTIIYAITDNESRDYEIDNIPYTFVFANKIGEKQ